MSWGGRRAQQARALLATTLPRPCSKCGRTVYPWHSWDLDHLFDRKHYPELTWVPSNHAPAHSRCNRSAGASMGNRERAPRKRTWTAPGW